MLKRQYDMLQTQLESERRETGRLMQIIESLRTEVARRDGEKGVREVHRGCQSSPELLFFHTVFHVHESFLGH